MLYRVLVDGEDILDYNDPELVLLSPQLEVELDTSGSFEFTVPPNHKLYSMFSAESIMAMSIEVWEDSVLHWFGRPIEFHLDFYKNKKINCEGGLAYFNDSVIRAEEWDQTPLSTIFAAVIAEHNSMVPSNRQFSVGNLTVQDKPVYRKFNYEQTFDVLKSKFLDAEDGHFFVRRENGVNYIDFLKDMPYSCNQDVEFAENLLNFTYNFDGKDFATCVIPLGAADQETGELINIKSVNGGSDILIGSAASNYGNIVKVQQYSDIEDPNELMNEGRKYLTTLQYNAFLIECSAVDLHSKDGTQQQFRVGQMVTCISNPHGIQLQLPISKMVLYLDSAAKQITLGRIPKKTLSRFYKEKIANGGDGGGIEEADEVPEGWAIVPPDIDGGEPTLKKVPIAIQVTHQPLQINYTQESNIFDITGLEVKAVATAQPLTYFSDERYPSGVIPHSELHFNASNGSQYYVLEPGQTNVLLFHKAKILVGIYWYCPYDNKKHIASFYITDKVQEAIDKEHGDGPDHIAVISTGLDYVVHKDGQYINTMGLRVKAYYPDGAEYDVDGYKDGLIPNTELRIVPKKADAGQIISYERDVSDTDLEAPVYLVPITVGMRLGGRVVRSVNGEIYGYSTSMLRDDSDRQITLVSLQAGASCYVTRPSGGFPATYSVGNTPYTYGEKTCYANNIYTGYNAPTDIPFSHFNGTDYAHDAAVALLGGKPMTEGDQVINVFWTAPDGNELTTTFNIRVKGGTQGGGR